VGRRGERLRPLRFGARRHDRLLAAACAAYDEARGAALSGRYSEAREKAKMARTLGLSHHALSALSALCVMAEGGPPADLEALPRQWREALNREGDAVRQKYAATVKAAREGDFSAALEGAVQCVALMPWLLPAQKIRLLSLVALERWEEADAVCERLRAEAPEEEDLARYAAEIRLALVPSVSALQNGVEAGAKALNGVEKEKGGVFLLNLSLLFRPGALCSRKKNRKRGGVPTPFPPSLAPDFGPRRSGPEPRSPAAFACFWAALSAQT
jgi:hypothetical protein